MANKFQKSIQERLEQEVARKKNEPSAPAKPAANGSQPIAATKQEAVPEVPHEAEPPVPAPADVSVYLRREPQRVAKNKTFYLDGEVIDAIKSTARAQQVTDSKLVNDILRRVLGL